MAINCTKSKALEAYRTVSKNESVTKTPNFLSSPITDLRKKQKQKPTLSSNRSVRVICGEATS